MGTQTNLQNLYNLVADCNSSTIELVEASLKRNDWYDAAETVAVDLGTDKQLDEVWALQEMQDKAGYLTDEIKVRRTPLSEQLNALLVAAGSKRYL